MPNAAPVPGVTATARDRIFDLNPLLDHNYTEGVNVAFMSLSHDNRPFTPGRPVKTTNASVKVAAYSCEHRPIRASVHQASSLQRLQQKTYA